ncbi:hypothetical protein H696_01071 [Fonticula alba]|uniref:BZIP domain-containing protein n=1 Tax=Fonticula alba TaxID=691883 RepID=A0A058ZDW3_FONAL|nr:hypothetical protein H696_01071 [Fonticula alba]KCV71652.1 hypothetical protein H696_01071 [Fonticula alba]|eukprot:XP_009493230.1 hypothetical protein H696_01071 [Fonticula alba]
MPPRAFGPFQENTPSDYLFSDDTKPEVDAVLASKRARNAKAAARSRARRRARHEALEVRVEALTALNELLQRRGHCLNMASVACEELASIQAQCRHYLPLSAAGTATPNSGGMPSTGAFASGLDREYPTAGGAPVQPAPEHASHTPVPSSGTPYSASHPGPGVATVAGGQHDHGIGRPAPPPAGPPPLHPHHLQQQQQQQQQHRSQYPQQQQQQQQQLLLLPPHSQPQFHHAPAPEHVSFSGAGGAWQPGPSPGSLGHMANNMHGGLPQSNCGAEDFRPPHPDGRSHGHQHQAFHKAPAGGGAGFPSASEPAGSHHHDRLHSHHHHHSTLHHAPSFGPPPHHHLEAPRPPTQHVDRGPMLS